jgi:hypothetical protein
MLRNIKYTDPRAVFAFDGAPHFVPTPTVSLLGRGTFQTLPSCCGEYIS